MDAAIALICDNQNLMPKLRKNRRIESRWGVKYHTAIRNAVFEAQTSPYRPPEVPPSLKGHVSDNDALYMCTQCKDCFHFQNSFEDHKARRSWILGFWCQQCFVTICTHVSTEGSPCSDCLKWDRDKRSYLRSRGLHKSHKFGAVRVFYNQCQFFAHLKTHNLNLVDMGDIMLMPLPTDVDSSWCSELDIACEALMEHAFMLRIHIIDWLKAKEIENNWWQLAIKKTKSNDDPVSKIVKGYRGRFFFKPMVTANEEQFSILNMSHPTSSNSRISPDVEIIESAENAEKKKSPTRTDIMPAIADENITEDEDNPCTVNDITFVDCGPASKYFEPEAPTSNISRRHTTIFVKSGQDSSNMFQPANIIKLNSKSKKSKTIFTSCTSSDVAISYGNTTITPKIDVKNPATCSADALWKETSHQYNKGKVPIKRITESNTVKVDSDAKLKKSIPETLLSMESSSIVHSDTSNATKVSVSKNKSEKLKQNAHRLTVSPGQKLLTVQSPLNVGFNTIINHLPSQLVNSKRILLLGQDTDGVTVHSKQESPVKKIVQVVPETSLGKGTKTIQTKVVSSNLTNDLSKDTNMLIVKTQSDSNINKTLQSSLPNKVVYQNGRKYIIKHSISLLKSTGSIPSIGTPKDSQAIKQASPENRIPSLIPLNSIESESSLTPERTTTFHSDISPLTPSPSPSELSSSSSCDVQSKQPAIAMKSVPRIDNQASQVNVDYVEAGISMLNVNDSYESLSFHKGEDENLYLDIKFFNQKPIHTIADTCGMITKCKQEMLNEFFHLSYSELKKRYDHLQNIHDEISQVMSCVADSVINENLKAVNILQHVLKHCIEKCIDKSDDSSGNDEPLNEWESEYETQKEKPICTSCNRILKCKSYIPGFSKPAKDDIYCSCYRYVCHKCLTYQGNSARFIAHRNYHNKEKPYLCPDCHRRFNVFRSLEVHTWTVCFHALKKRILGCKICEIDGFQDMESITRHFAIMHSHNKIACDKCYIVLPSYSEYKKHNKEVHSVTEDHEPIRLVLCKLGRCIVRYEDYMTHMEKHLVVQRLVWYKCPFCTFINLEAKRITSHFQAEHLQRLPEIISPETLWDLLPAELSMNLFKGNPRTGTASSLTKFQNVQEEPCKDGTVLPKIINTRTITSEVFERGAEDGEGDLLTDIGSPTSMRAGYKNGNNTSTCDMSESRRLVDSKLGLFGATLQDGNKADALPKILEIRSIVDESSRDSKSASTKRTFPDKNTKEVQLVEGSKGTNNVGFKVKKQTEKSKRNSLQERVAKSKLKSSRGVLSDTMDTKASTSNADKFNVKELRSQMQTDTETAWVTIGNKGSTFDTGSKSPVVKKTENMNEVDSKELADGTNDIETVKKGEITEHSSISKPPPLARIPQHILQSNKPDKSVVHPTKGGKERSTVYSRHQKTTRPLRRLALNGPATTKAKTLEFSCHSCGELINTSWPVISAHFKKKHSQDYKLSIVTPKLLRISPEFVNGGYKELFGNRKRKLDNVPSNAKRRRRWTPKKYTETRNTNSPGLGLYVQQETAEDGEGNFKCKKCNQRCTDMADLREHIASNHRIKGRYLICLECGENFVVAPSLQMHLKAFHGIEDPITYMTQNTSYAPDSVDELEIEGKTIEANQCHVCMAVFEDKAAVDKHLRVHGMAFLNRKRIEAQNALKSPEKKSDSEEGKQSLIKDTPKELARKEKPAETILEKINATI